ncbi:MAG: hypothetical protein IT374_14505 [Polyangiaceae bacterium]|nr:hypothetical protein [Polyangiaceae bacterium]
MLAARVVALSLLCSPALAGCAEDSPEPIFLGVAGSGAFQVPPTFVPGGGAGAGGAGAAGAAGAGGAPACSLSLPVASVDAATALDRALEGYALAVGAEVRALDGAACPESASATASPGVGTIRALATVDGVAFVAGASGVRAGAATCPGGGLVSLAREGARAVGLTADGASLARLSRVTAKPGSGVPKEVCEREDVPLLGAARAVTLGASAVPGTVWAAFAPTSGSVFVARVDVATGATLPDVKLTSLCGADAVVDLGARIAVLDATCRRVAVFESSGARVIDRSLGALPRAMAASADDAAAVIIASAISTPPTARVDFQRLSLAD